MKALLIIVERLTEAQRLRNRQFAASTGRLPVDPFAGRSAAIRKLAEEARRVLPTESPILILGETGSGKGVLAAWLHANGARGPEAFGWT